jgi:hypothetical protein
MVGMISLLLVVVVVWWLMIFVIVCGLAASVSGSRVHSSCVFTGSAAIWGHSTGPALAITGGGPIGVLQGFVFDVGIRVGGEAPDSVDLFVHVGGSNI